jgi:ribonuclease-3
MECFKKRINIMAEDIEKFKYLIDYDFKDKNLLREALTHRSFTAEKGLNYDNQRLEFLGDAVLQIILTEFLYNSYKQKAEGPLTKMRSAMARQETLARIAKELGFGKFLLCGKGEIESKGTERNSTLSDLLEAVIGALYLDAGLDITRKLVIEWMHGYLNSHQQSLEYQNPKGTLQEYCQRKWATAPEYNVISVSGPEHNPIYQVSVTINNQTIAEGYANKRKQAESLAAQNAITQLSEKDKSIQDFL